MLLSKFSLRTLFFSHCKDLIFELSDVPLVDTALVLGGRVAQGGGLTSLMRARMDLVWILFQEGKIKRVLLSGNAHHHAGDEVLPMKRFLLQREVDPSVISVDGGAVRTWASMMRTRSLWGLEKVIVVTNHFHLPRSLVLARRAGLQAAGVVVRDPMPSRYRTALWRKTREELSCGRAIMEGMVESARLRESRKRR